MNGIFDADYATSKYCVITSERFEHPLPIKAQIDHLSASRRFHEARKREAQCTVLVHEHRRLPMNGIFDAEYATSKCFVITSERFEHPYLARLFHC